MTQEKMTMSNKGSSNNGQQPVEKGYQPTQSDQSAGYQPPRNNSGNSGTPPKKP